MEQPRASREPKSWPVVAPVCITCRHRVGRAGRNEGLKQSIMKAFNPAFNLDLEIGDSVLVVGIGVWIVVSGLGFG